MVSTWETGGGLICSGVAGMYRTRIFLEQFLRDMRACRYVWLPLSFSSGNPVLVQADVWSINLAAGTTFLPPQLLATTNSSPGTYSVASGVTYEAESGTISGSAVLTSSSSFSGGKYVGYLGKRFFWHMLYTLELP